MPPPPPPPVPPVNTQSALAQVSHEDVIDFLKWLHKHRKRKRYWPRLDDKAVLQFVPARFKDKLGGIARMIMMQIMKRPAPPRELKPRGGAPASLGDRPTTKRRSKPKIARPTRKAIKTTTRRARG